MKRTTVVTVLIVGLLLAGTHAFGWPGGHEGRKGLNCGQGSAQGMSDEQRQQRHDQHLEKMAIILDLTDNQKQELQTLHEQRQQRQQSLRTEIQDSRDKMRSAGKASEFNEAEFRTTAQQHAELKTRMMSERAKARQEMATILTPEQLAKAEQLGEMRGDGMRNCSGNEHRGHQGKAHKRQGFSG